VRCLSRRTVNKKFAFNPCVENLRESSMAKGEQRGNRESKKPKKQKIKTIAAAPSQKTTGWQPNFGSEKKK
jgi:hypothetical protein